MADFKIKRLKRWKSGGNSAISTEQKRFNVCIKISLMEQMIVENRGAGGFHRALSLTERQVCSEKKKSNAEIAVEDK